MEELARVVVQNIIKFSIRQRIGPLIQTIGFQQSAPSFVGRRYPYRAKAEMVDYETAQVLILIK